MLGGLLRFLTCRNFLSATCVHCVYAESLSLLTDFTHLCIFLKIHWYLLLSLETFWLCWGPLALSPLSNFTNPTQRTCVYEEFLTWPDAYYCSLKPFDCAVGHLRFPHFLTSWIMSTQRTCVYEEFLPWPDVYHCSLKPFDCAGGRLRFPRFLTLCITSSVLAFMNNY